MEKRILLAMAWLKRLQTNAAAITETSRGDLPGPNAEGIKRCGPKLVGKKRK